LKLGSSWIRAPSGIAELSLCLPSLLVAGQAMNPLLV
jgi:hypothetical protein